MSLRVLAVSVRWDELILTSWHHHENQVREHERPWEACLVCSFAQDGAWLPAEGSHMAAPEEPAIHSSALPVAQLPGNVG